MDCIVEQAGRRAVGETAALAGQGYDGVVGPVSTQNRAHSVKTKDQRRNRVEQGFRWGLPANGFEKPVLIVPLLTRQEAGICQSLAELQLKGSAAGRLSNLTLNCTPSDGLALASSRGTFTDTCLGL